MTSNFQKTLRVVETASDYRLQIIIATSRGGIGKPKEIARFAKTGMGHCAMGAAGRYLTGTLFVDHLEFCGTQKGYDMLVGLGIIDPKEVTHH